MKKSYLALGLAFAFIASQAIAAFSPFVVFRGDGGVSPVAIYCPATLLPNSSVSQCSFGSGLPPGTGALPTGATTIATANTYQQLFAPGSINHGAFVQNKSTNSASVFVDIAGATGTTLAASSQEVLPGYTWQTNFLPTNAITVRSTATVTFNAGSF